jgi:hypothetical protein
MDIQQLEFNAPLRIKFASKSEHGHPASAYDEYRDLFPDPVTPLEGDWSATRSEEIKTRPKSHGQHNTWILSHDQIKIGAVEHEDGIEFLLSIASGVAVSVISPLVLRMWSKWGGLRKKYHPKETVSFVLEINSRTFPDGRSETESRIEKSGQVSDETIIEETEKALDKLRTENKE